VIGVAADVKYSTINEAPRPYVYLPFLQAYRSHMILHARTTAIGAAAVGALVTTMRDEVTAADANLPSCTRSRWRIRRAAR